MKTANLLGRRGAALLTFLILGIAAVPALASNGTTAKSEPTPVAAPVAAPATMASAGLLVAPTPIASPDTAPVAAQLDALQKAQDAGSAPSTVKTILQRAFAMLGTPYRYGGSSPEGGFDCSGLVGYVFRTIGIDLPRVSRSMAAQGVRIETRDALAEGDLVFFGKRGRIDHVGIYVGNGQFVHAPRTGRDVTVSSMTGGYWGQLFMEARRIGTGS